MLTENVEKFCSFLDVLAKRTKARMIAFFFFKEKGAILSCIYDLAASIKQRGETYGQVRTTKVAVSSSLYGAEQSCVCECVSLLRYEQPKICVLY